MEWDIIYGHGVLYANAAAAEEARVPGSDVVWAGHRKVTDFYLLSRAGARKLASSGFRECVFPVDDFLPAVHARSSHPRRDVARLACVRALREGPGGGLVAFAVARDAVRCKSACRTAGSASKSTACLIGDLGAQIDPHPDPDPDLEPNSGGHEPTPR